MSNGFEEYIMEARELAENGDIDGSIGMYKSALEEDPTYEEVRREIINLTLRKGDFQQAIVEYFDWAEACQVTGAIDDAIRIYQEILGLDTLLQKKVFMMDQQVAQETITQVQETIQAASGAIFFNLGYLYLEKGALDEAISCLQKSLEFNPSDAKTHTLLGQVYMQKGLDKEAIGEFQEVVRLAPDEAAYAYEMLGEIFIRGGKAPQSTIVWFRNAGDLYVRHQQFEEAIRAYERILSFEPQNKDVLTRLGEIYAKQEWTERAIEIFKQLADIFREEGLLDKVIIIYEKIVQIDPSNGEARDEIINIYRKILEHDPDNLTARSKLIGNILRRGTATDAIPEFLALSETYLGKGMKKEAFAVCRKLLELDSSNARAHELIADILFEQDQKDKALQEYLLVLNFYQERDEDDKAAAINEKLIAKFPGTKEVTLQVARNYKNRGEFEKALLEFKKLLDEDPKNVELMKSMLEIFEKIEDVNNVVAFSERIMEIDPSQAVEMQDKIIGIYEKAGDKDKILEIYQKILDKDPSRNDLRQKILEIYETSGNENKIIQMYMEMLESEPGRTDIRQKLIEYYAQSGRINDVLRESSSLADILVKNDEVDKAEGLYKNVLAFMPNDTTIRGNLCEIYEQKGEVEKVQDELLVLANISYREGNLTESVKRCQKILEYTPNDMNLKMKIARMSAASGDTDEAVQQYRDIADTYMEKQMTESAKEVIQKILQVDEENVEYRKKMIDILKNQFKTVEAIDNYKILLSYFLKVGQNDDALVSAREAIALQPMDLELRKVIVTLFLEGKDVENGQNLANELIDLYLGRSEYNEVVDLYNRLSNIYKDQDDMDTYYEYREKIAQIFEKQDKYSDAISEYLSIIKTTLMNSNTGEAQRLFPIIINLYFKEERPSEAIDSFTEIVEQLDKSEKVDEAIITLEHIESIQERIEKWDLALETLHKMIKHFSKLNLEEKIINTHRRRIEIFLKQKDVEKAIDEMFEIINFHLAKDDLDSATTQFEEVEHFEPDEPRLVFRMAETLFDREYYEKAQPMYERVLNKEPENYDAMARVAIILARDSKLQEAVTYTRKIFSKGLIAEVIEAYRKSTRSTLAESQIHINLGLFYQEMGFIEEAMFEFQQAAQDKDKLLEAYNLLALCFKQEGFIDLAVRQFERALEQPGFAEDEYLSIRYNLGETLMEAERFQEALSAFYECYMVDINYRDISEKIAFLNEKLQDE